MSVRNGLLALLAEQPNHCYGLKSDFEQRTGRAWVVNIGQIYSTLERLERDGLVEPQGDDDGQRQRFRLTSAGRSQLEAWFEQPVVVDPPARDEMAIKLLLAVGAPDVDADRLIQRQRGALMQVLQRYTRQKAALDERVELATVLLHDALILKVEAEIRWLDLCEARLRRRATAAVAHTDGNGA